MAAFHHHIDHEIKNYKPPPFKFPPSDLPPVLPSITTIAPNAPSAPIQDELPLLETLKQPSLSEVFSSLKPTPTPDTIHIISTKEADTLYEDFFQAVETVQSKAVDATNNTPVRGVLNTVNTSFYNENFTTSEDAAQSNGTIFEVLTTDESKLNLYPNNVSKAFDWMKPADDLDNANAVLRMAKEDSTLLETGLIHNYAMYIIWGSMLALLVILTIVMILLYRAYKSRDDYNLTADSKRVKVFKSSLAEASTSQAETPTRDDYEIVDFDKNCYRF